jgi:hypothetical protein
VGSCGLFAWNREWAKCSTGYELARTARGQGLMREALRAAFDWGFAQMGLHRIEAQIHPDNAPSLALAEGLGFVREGRLREVGFLGRAAARSVAAGSLARRLAAAPGLSSVSLQTHQAASRPGFPGFAPGPRAQHWRHPEDTAMNTSLPAAAGAALALWALLTSPAQADLSPLDAARAAGGERPGQPPPPLPGGLAALLPVGSYSVDTIDRATFLAQLAQRGVDGLPAALYDGRDVSLYSFADQPFDLSLDLARLIAQQSAPGLKPLGTLTFSGMNLGGTVVWVWGH